MIDENAPNSPPPTIKAKWGAVSLVAFAAMSAAVVLLLLFAAAIGGCGTYASEWLRGSHELAPRFGAALSGALAAIVGCLAGPPVGFLLANLKSETFRSVGMLAAFAAMLLVPIVHSGIFVLSGLLGAIAGFFAEVFLTPLPTAIATAIVATLLGFCFGIAIAADASSDTGGGIEL